MMPLPRAITFDLDDTLWPFAPIGARIEERLDQWFRQHAPKTARQFPVAAMRRMRERMLEQFPEKAHDVSWLRRRGIETALAESGEDPALAEAAYAVFFAERNRVTFYPDSLPALSRIARLCPLATISNGNADLEAIGIAGYFPLRVCAREFGKAKPDAGIFHHTCERLGLAPAEVLHVGDDVHADIAGAHHAGLATCWLHRDDARARVPTWPRRDFTPTLTFSTLAALADWLEARAPAEMP